LTFSVSPDVIFSERIIMHLMQVQLSPLGYKFLDLLLLWTLAELTATLVPYNRDLGSHPILRINALFLLVHIIFK